ncbi:hypothetical protein PoB_003989100, partial [Plakobranchus ocellatus]
VRCHLLHTVCSSLESRPQHPVDLRNLQAYRPVASPPGDNGTCPLSGHLSGDRRLLWPQRLCPFVAAGTIVDRDTLSCVPLARAISLAVI